MKYSKANRGRLFIIRLEDGDIIHETLEKFAQDHHIKAASLIILGGADKDSTLITGPENGRSKKIIPMEYPLPDVSEVTGTGTLFPNEQGDPILHMHIACGRETSTMTGCIRRGVKVWHVMEVILQELTDSQAVRSPDPTTGFELLNPYPR